MQRLTRPAFFEATAHRECKLTSSFLKILFMLFLIPTILHGGISRGEARVMQSSVDSWVQQSRFIFRGTIVKLNAATMPSVPVSESTVVVNVDEVFQAPPALGDLTGKEITVRLSRPGSVKANTQIVFFTTSWIYGKSIAVAEVARIESKVDPANFRRQIADASQRIADQALLQRIGRAELVVSGRVSDTKPLQRAERGPITEHDPEWWEATIEVASVEKGQPQQRLNIIFANSTDEFWYDSPKFQPGQEGVWILQRDQQESGFPKLRIPGYTGLDPLDFHPRSQLEHIRDLTKRSQ